MIERLWTRLRRAGSAILGVRPPVAVDLLTGLESRTAFRDRIEQARHHRQWGAVALLDINHVKLINDRHGHSAGDDLLVTIATRLRKALPSEAGLARMGGDEFLVYFRGLDASTAAVEVRKALAAASEPLPSGLAAGQRITLSAGVCNFSGRPVDHVFSACDAAMYVAKHRGRDQVQVFGDDMRGVMGTRRELASTLAALQERNRELTDLAYKDALTGLRNRLALDGMLDQRLGPSHGPLGFDVAAVAFLDVDHFSQFNKRRGDADGDQALVAIANRLLETARGEDLVYRKGGEEFVVILPGTTGADARAAAERFRSGIETLGIAHPGSPTAPHLTITVGVACASSEATIRQLMTAAAELAMLAKVNDQRNQVHQATLDPRPAAP